MRRLRFLGLLMLIAAAAAQPKALQQTPQQPRAANGAISGVVTDGKTGRPIAGALVQLTTVGPGSESSPLIPVQRPRQMTDGSGRFVFQRLAAGSYGVRVVASGYLSGGYGRVPGFGAVAQILLQDQQWF